MGGLSKESGDFTFHIFFHKPKPRKKSTLHCPTRDAASERAADSPPVCPPLKLRPPILVEQLNYLLLVDLPPEPG